MGRKAVKTDKQVDREHVGMKVGRQTDRLADSRWAGILLDRQGGRQTVNGQEGW